MSQGTRRRGDRGFVPIGEIIPEVMGEIIDRATKADHPPPQEIIDRFPPVPEDHQGPPSTPTPTYH